MISHKNEDWLHDQYVNQKKSIYEIAKEFNCTYKTIFYWLKKFDIPRRSISEANKISMNKTKVKEKISEAMKGKNNPNYAKKHSKKTREKMSEAKKGKNNHNYGNFKEDVGYRALHMWVNKWKQKTGICTICNEYKKTEWSNINHLYKRNLDDYWELCRDCHKLYDKLMKKRGWET